MNKIRPDPLLEVNFRCFDCDHKWASEPKRIEDAPELVWHPFRYFTICPNCGAQDIPQVSWERALLKAYAHATGPKTPEGKKASAKNLEGQMTREILMRARFGQMKHGLRARTATFFPAKPGKYPHCQNCEHFNNGCNEADKPMKRPPACLKRMELFMLHHIAFEQGDPRLLMTLHADTQAAVRGLIDDMILAIVTEGVSLKTPKWHFDSKEKKFHVVQYLDDEGEKKTVIDIQAHPLLRTLGDYLAKNAMSLSDMEMTPKSRDEQDAMNGYLDAEGETAESAREFQQRTDEGLENLRRLIARGHEPQYIEDAVIVEEDDDA